MDAKTVLELSDKPKEFKIPVTIRVSKETSAWMKQKKFRPSVIFNQALKELGCPHI